MSQGLRHYFLGLNPRMLCPPNKDTWDLGKAKKNTIHTIINYVCSL